MLFLVISTPRRSKMSKELVKARLAFREWINSLKKRVVCFYPRKDRGAVVMFNLGSKQEKGKVLRRWRTFVRVKLEVYPLQEPALSQKILEKSLRRFREKK